MNCLVVDDEPLARTGLAAYVVRTEGLSLLGCCSTFGEARAYLRTHHIDLLLLDIGLPDEDGLQAYRTLIDAPAVIFITAFAEHALAGYEVQAVDYLLKPVTYQRFSKAIEAARIRLAASPLDRIIWLRVGTSSVSVRPEAIRYVEGMENYAAVHTTSGKLVAHTTLQALQDRLSPSLFLRVHRSFIVNRGHIRSVHTDHLRVDGREIPIGRKYRDAVRANLAGHRDQQGSGAAHG